MYKGPINDNTQDRLKAKLVEAKKKNLKYRTLLMPVCKCRGNRQQACLTSARLTYPKPKCFAKADSISSRVSFSKSERVYV